MSKDVSTTTPAIAEKPGFSPMAYFQGVRQEWHKISWPPREQVIAETGVVLIVVTAFSLGIFLLDKLFQLLITWIT